MFRIAAASIRNCAPRTLSSATSTMTREIAMSSSALFFNRTALVSPSHAMERAFSISSMMRQEQIEEEEQQQQQEQSVEENKEQQQEQNVEETELVQEQEQTEEHKLEKKEEHKRSDMNPNRGLTMKRYELTAQEEKDIEKGLIQRIYRLPSMFTREDMQYYLTRLGIYSVKRFDKKGNPERFPIDRIIPVYVNGFPQSSFVVHFESAEQLERLEEKHKEGRKRVEGHTVIRSTYIRTKPVTREELSNIKTFLVSTGLIDWDVAQRAAVISFHKKKRDLHAETDILTISMVKNALIHYDVAHVHSFSKRRKVVVFSSKDELHRALRGTAFGTRVVTRNIPPQFERRMEMEPFN